MPFFKTKLLILGLGIVFSNVAFATSPDANIECRIYDPTKRCVWVLKSNPDPPAYVAPKKAVRSKSRKQYDHSKTAINPILAPLPILAEPVEKKAGTAGIVMDTMTGMNPTQNQLQPVLKEPEPKPLSGRVEMNAVMPPVKAITERPVKISIRPKVVIPNSQRTRKALKDQLQSQYSWVNLSSDSFYHQLAEEVVAFIGQQNLSQNKLLRVLPALQSDNLLTPVLIQALRAKGYAIASEEAQLLNATTIRYVVDETPGGILLRIQIDQAEAAKWLVLDQSRTSLLAASVFTVRQRINHDD